MERDENLDLREEAVVAARLEEVIDGVVVSVVRIAVRSGCAAHRRPAAGVVGAAVAHSEKHFANKLSAFCQPDSEFRWKKPSRISKMEIKPPLSNPIIYFQQFQLKPSCSLCFLLLRNSINPWPHLFQSLYKNLKKTRFVSVTDNFSPV